MAGSTSRKDFVRHALAPRVAVFASDDAETLCQRNGLSFCELIAPFCNIPWSGRSFVSNLLSNTAAH
jgi:hypothetical protein